MTDRMRAYIFFVVSVVCVVVGIIAAMADNLFVAVILATAGWIAICFAKVYAADSN